MLLYILIGLLGLACIVSAIVIFFLVKVIKDQETQHLVDETEAHLKIVSLQNELREARTDICERDAHLLECYQEMHKALGHLEYRDNVIDQLFTERDAAHEMLEMLLHPEQKHPSVVDREKVEEPHPQLFSMS